MVSNYICKGGRSLRIVVGIIMFVLLLAGGAAATWQWEQTFVESGNEGAYSVQQTSNGVYVPSGDVMGSGNYESRLIRISEAGVITVNASGGADYTSIQDAINNASAGDTILVNSGTYEEHININKQLILRGIDNGSGKPVIRYNGSFGLRPVDITANDVTFEGFNITNSTYRYGAGFVISIVFVNNSTIENNTIIYNDIGGVAMAMSDNNTIRNNIISHNNGSGITTGIVIGIMTDNNSNNNTVTGNDVTFNNNGLSLYYSNNNTVFDNNFSNSGTIGIGLSYSNYNNIIGNNVSNNTRAGMRMMSSSNITILNNNISNNMRFGINSVRSSNNNTISGNHVIANTLAGLNLNLSNDNLIFNNLFNNSENFRSSGVNQNNTWNVSESVGINIINGLNISGNFWANPDGMGFSQTCIDAGRDGICDSSFPLNANNTDFLPLAPPDAPTVFSEIHGRIFNDSNGTGTMDTGESGISGVLIHLTRMISPGTEFLAGIKSTDTNGNYSFTGISSGNYRIEEFPAGSVQTFPANGMPRNATLGVGENMTGVDFGNQMIDPGEIRGMKFNDLNTNGSQDAGEDGLAGVTICIFLWRCEVTNGSGNYSFQGIPPGNYTVFEMPTSGSVPTTPTMVTITVNPGDVMIVNFGNHLPVPPPQDITVAQQSGEQNGVPTVFRPGLTNLTINKNLTNISNNVVSVNLTLNWSDGTTRSANMTEIDSTNVWTATFDAPFSRGTAEMRFEVDVAPAGVGPEDAIEIGDIIFIDPSGQIKNACSGDPISNANVMLLVEYPPGSNSFTESPPEYQMPSDNPLITGLDGRYSWLTIPGTYKVRAEKAGYATAESAPVSVPPPATGLDISLTPTGGCGTLSATITVNASGGADYTRIQDAIDNATTGDTILVQSGTYYEHVNVNKQFILQGVDTGGGKPVVDGGGSGSPMRLSVDKITVDSFVTNNTGNVWCDAGIRVFSNNNTLRDNNVLDGCNGIDLSNSNGNTLINNTVNSKNYAGISLSNSNDNTLIGNNASNSKGDYAYGINLYNSNNNTLIGNQASNNTEGVYWNFGITLGYSSNNNITGNVVTSNANGGISLWGSNNNNTLDGNILDSNNESGIELGRSSNNNNVTNNIMINNGNGVSIWNFSNHNKVTNNTMTNNRNGIGIWNFSNYNILSNNNASFNNEGISIRSSSNNNILYANTVNSNNQNGLLLINSSNNNISNNSFISNKGSGIRITSNSIYNNVSGNTASDNTEEGILLGGSSNNHAENNIAFNNTIGFKLTGFNHTLKNNTAYNNIYGIRISSYDIDRYSHHIVTENVVINNIEYGIIINYSSENSIYNNYFNNTNNSGFNNTPSNFWNTTRTSGTNIINGPYLGGNFWANPDGTGFSQACIDGNGDGICNSTYVLDANNTDFLPLTYGNNAVPNLYLSKQAPAYKDNGRNMKYRLHYVNLGGAIAQNVSINDTLPPEVVFVNASDGGIYDSSTRNVTWNIGSVPPSGNGSRNVTVSIPGSVAAGTVINNTAIISTSDVETQYDDNFAQTNTTVTTSNLPSNVSVEPHNNGIGVPSVGWNTPINFSYHSCEGGSGVNITINITYDNGTQGPVITGSMAGGPPNWTYPITFYPLHGSASITYNISGCDTKDITFHIRIDPAGYIYDAATGERIQNATVWLQQSNGSTWENVPTGLPDPISDPDINPLITGVNGQYQWDVYPGFYRVQVEAAGYYLATSIVVTIPPPVTDLNVGLIRKIPPGVKNLTNTTYASTYINWTWTDPQDPDFAKVMIYLDGVYKENVSKGVQYYNATFVPGTYTIGTRTVDIFGNVNATMVTHIATTILPAIRFINGTVMDNVNKTGISGVKVFTNTSNSTMTNASGFYSFAVASGTYNITATFEPTYYTNSTTVSTIGEAVVIQDIELINKPTGNITGKVTSTI